MTRVFGRGELKRAVLEIIADVGPAHGYAVLDALRDRVGGHWRPSPGAVYPAIIALEDAGLIATVSDGENRAYRATTRGRREIDRHPRVIDAVAARVASRPPTRTLGDMLDHFASTVPHRRQPLDPATQATVLALLERTGVDLRSLTATPFQGEQPNG